MGVELMGVVGGVIPRELLIPFCWAGVVKALPIGAEWRLSRIPVTGDVRGGLGEEAASGVW